MNRLTFWRYIIIGNWVGKMSSQHTLCKLKLDLLITWLLGKYLHIKQIGNLQLSNIKFREHTTYIMYLSGNIVSDTSGQKTLTFWTHFERALSASPVWQEMPGHTHILDTLWESTVSQSSLTGNARSHSHTGHILREHCQPVQFGKKCQVTLTRWAHLERALSASPVWQEMPGHTHPLDTFWESTVSQASLAENARSHLQTGHIWENTDSQSTLIGNARSHLQTAHILREHCQPVQFDSKCQVKLTSWTHCERALLASPV